MHGDGRGMMSEYDWSKEPEPWRTVGPRFADEVRSILSQGSLRSRRMARGLSQADLAERVGCTQAQISRIERGSSRASEEIAAKIERALKR